MYIVCIDNYHNYYITLQYKIWFWLYREIFLLPFLIESFVENDRDTSLLNNHQSISPKLINLILIQITFWGHHEWNAILKRSSYFSFKQTIPKIYQLTYKILFHLWKKWLNFKVKFLPQKDNNFDDFKDWLTLSQC